MPIINPTAKPEQGPINYKLPGQKEAGEPFTSDRSSKRRWWRNMVLTPMADLFGFKVKPDFGYGTDYPDEDPIQWSEGTTQQEKDTFHELLDNVSGRLQDITQEMPDISLAELEQITPTLFPTPEQISQSIPQLPSTEFGPIEQRAREQFQNETIPSLAERFAGSGGLNSSALAGQLGKAGSDLESQLAALRSQHGIEQGRLNLQGQDIASRRAALLGQLGLGQQAQQIAQGQALGNLRLGQQGQKLAERSNIGNLLQIPQKRQMVATERGDNGLTPNLQPLLKLGQKAGEYAAMAAL